MVDVGCTFNESAIELTWMKRWVSNRNDERCTSQDPFVCGLLEMVLVLAFKSTSASTNQSQSSVQEGAFLGPARVLLQERERKGDDLKYKL